MRSVFEISRILQFISLVSLPAITSLKLIIKALEQGVKYVQS